MTVFYKIIGPRDEGYEGLLHNPSSAASLFPRIKELISERVMYWL
jgi:hypothetical protein